MLTAKKLQSLLNGGAAAAGVDGLAAEIAALKNEAANCRRELANVPARRSQLILEDTRAALDALEARERELYRDLEKIDIQLSMLEPKLVEIEWRQLMPRLEKHRAIIGQHVQALDKLLVEAIAANKTVERVTNEAASELGHLANRLPLLQFGGLLNEQCLAIWRNQRTDQLARLADQKPPQKPLSQISGGAQVVRMG